MERGKGGASGAGGAGGHALVPFKVTFDWVERHRGQGTMGPWGQEPQKVVKIGGLGVEGGWSGGRAEPAERACAGAI